MFKKPDAYKSITSSQYIHIHITKKKPNAYKSINSNQSINLKIKNK